MTNPSATWQEHASNCCLSFSSHPKSWLVTDIFREISDSKYLFGFILSAFQYFSLLDHFLFGAAEKTWKNNSPAANSDQAENLCKRRQKSIKCRSKQLHTNISLEDLIAYEMADSLFSGRLPGSGTESYGGYAPVPSGFFLHLHHPTSQLIKGQLLDS